MIEFTVSEPYKIPFTINKGIKLIKVEDTFKFWETVADIGTQKGCYIFALKHKSIVPYYVGRSSNFFKNEIFTAHKMNKYNEVLHLKTHGIPLFFFVTYPFGRAKLNDKALDDLETYLIQSAVIVNPKLENIYKKERKWTIRNVIDKRPGKSKKCEEDFAKMLKLLKKQPSL